MSKPGFMSPEHVAAMNAILEENADVRAACAELPSPMAFAYELANGPEGETVHWAMMFGDTLRFSLEQVEADLVLRGDWARTIRSLLDRSNPGLETVGDIEVMTTTARAFAAAKAVARISTQFPDI